MIERKGILVVDDTIPTLTLLEGILKGEGYTVWTATSGADALAQVERHPPEMIVLDIQMPGMDGFEVCRQVKVSPATRDIPVMFLSVSADSDEQVKGFTLGAVDFISKPFHRQELLARVRTHLDLSRLRSHLESEVAARTMELSQTNAQLRRELVERREREEQLRASEELFSKAFHSSPISMAISSLQTRKFMNVNTAFERNTGYKREELIGRTASELGIWEENKLAEGLFQQLSTAGGYHGFEFRFHTKKGDLRSGRLSADTIEYAGQSCILTVAEDVTERVLLENQLRQAQKLEAVGQLAGGVAHDFSNILSAMLMNLDLLQEEPGLSDETKGGLKELECEATRASGLIRQLLLFSRRQNADARPHNLNEIITNLIKMLKRLMRENIHLEYHPEPSSLWINADAGMMEQVVMNLFVNACDAMEQGGRLTIRTSQVRLEPPLTAHLHPNARPGLFVCFSIVDEGCGMDEETQKRIFEPFFTTKEVGKGTGLGLATVFGIVKQHQGWIEVDSAPGKGSAFRVYIPALVKGTDSSELNPGHEIRGGSECILVAEDEHSVRRVIVLGLRKLGYAVLESADAKHALKLWHENKGRIDLLLTDMIMPGGLSGLDLALQMRQEKPELKVIVSSGYNTILSNPDVLASHGFAGLAKPYDSVILARAVRSCLDHPITAIRS
jgi:PAS domain S-box-containing protein